MTALKLPLKLSNKEVQFIDCLILTQRIHHSVQVESPSSQNNRMQNLKIKRNLQYVNN